METLTRSRPRLSALSFTIVGIIALTMFSLTSCIAADAIHYQKRSMQEALSVFRPASGVTRAAAEKKGTDFTKKTRSQGFLKRKGSLYTKDIEKNTKVRIQQMLDQLASRPRPIPTDDGIVNTMGEFDDHFMQVYADILQQFQQSGEVVDLIAAKVNKVNRWVNPGSVSDTPPIAPPVPLTPENPTSYREMNEKMRVMFINIIAEMTHLNASIDIIQDALLETRATLFPNTETYKFDPCEEGFGYSIAVTNDYMIVGAPYANENVNWWADDVGRAYLYKKLMTRWYLVFTFEPGPLPDGVDRSYMNFGSGVAMEYNTSTYVVGAQSAHTTGYYSGAVYVFHCNADDECEVTHELWPSRTYKPIGPPPATPVQYDGDSSLSLFGSTVAVQGDWILVGSPYDVGQDGSSILGSVYFFHLENLEWVYHSKVYGTEDTMSYGHGSLGNSVTIQETRAATFNPATRAVYVFEYRDTYWSLTNELVDTFNVYQEPSVSVLLKDDRIVVSSATGVTVMAFNGVDAWQHVHIAMKEGTHVADLENDTIIVGSSNDPRYAGGWSVGSASIYKYNGRQWKLNALLVAKRPEQSAAVGFAVALESGTAYVGAPYASGGRGAVYAYDDLLVQAEPSYTPAPEPSHTPTAEHFYTPTPKPS